MDVKTIITDKLRRRADLKRLLASTDYKRNKWIDGELTDEEWSPIREQCKAWRAEINVLEAEIAELRAKL